MKIIDTFLFSEPYEKEILLIKLHLGGDFIHEWVLIENSYTHQGEFKGLFAEEMLYSDVRFKPFLNRIKIISGNLTFKRIDYDDKSSDKIGSSQEWQQRDLVKKYLLETYTSEDYFTISDTDECMDLTSNDLKLTLLKRKIRENVTGVIQIPRKRFWYDFDNVWLAKRSVPLVKIDYLIRNPQKLLGEIRQANMGPCKPWELELLYEYSFCLSKEHLLRKYQTFCHVGMYKEDVELGLKCNHIPVMKTERSLISLDPKYWLRKVVLNRDNSPWYVRENFDKLRTGIVDSDFINNRKTVYPNLFSLQGRMIWEVRKIGFFFKKLRNKMLVTLKIVHS